MALKACLTCGALTPNARCPTHAHHSTGTRGSTRTWRQTRNTVLARDGYACTTCGSTHNLEVHHLQPKRHGGTDNPNNLVTLCHNHHTR